MALKNTISVSIELDIDLNQKLESKFLKLKIDALKRGSKISKKNFYGYLLTKGITAFQNEELEEFLTKAENNKL